MYTSTMTPDELANEFSKDFEETALFYDAKRKQVNKLLKKSRIFPVYIKTSFKSKRGNNWIILIHGKNNKQTIDDCNVTIFSHFDCGSGRYAIIQFISDDEPFYIMFTPHFFKRYAERANIHLTGVDLIRRYFKKNGMYGFESDTESFGNLYKRNMYGSSEEGIAMGVLLPSKTKIILFRTFITYDMCKGKQIDDFARTEAIRKEMHSDD